MYRTRDWRRTQRSRILKRVVEFKRLTQSHYELPNPVENFCRWMDRNGNWRYYHSWHDVHEERWYHARLQAGNRAMCSNYCCGNPRKWFGDLTIQELRHTLDGDHLND